MCQEFISGESVPPVSPGAFVGLPAQLARCVITSRVDDTDGDFCPRMFDCECKVGIVGHNHRRINNVFENVNQQVGGNIDVSAFFLLLLVRDEEVTRVFSQSRPRRGR